MYSVLRFKKLKLMFIENVAIFLLRGVRKLRVSRYLDNMWNCREHRTCHGWFSVVLALFAHVVLWHLENRV